MIEERFLRLAVDAPLPETLTYRTTEKWPTGSSVIAPLGKRKVPAVIIGEGKNSSEYKIRDIDTFDESRPTLNSIHVQWLTWMAEYYVHPIGQVASLCFPPLKNRNSNRKSSKSAVVKTIAQDKPPVLTTEQEKCVADIQSQSGFGVHLLFGVTGSGKTEVYLHLLEQTLKEGKKGLVLVPEISLTPQLIQRFSARFGDQIAVIHSHLTDRERTNQWWSIVDGDKKILIGARSALFCPIENLGIIIVDEEHEPSYKQEEKLRYNARDSAIMLAKFYELPIVLGSATPSLESWQNAQTGKYKLHRMKLRVAERKLPKIEIVDLRCEKDSTNSSTTEDRPFWLSPVLFDGIQNTLAKNEQVALFLNRRGIAPTVICTECGYVYRCPNCEITLTLHGQHNLVCHYCDYNVRMTESCPSCKEGEPKPVGLGTEQIENDLKLLFPNKVIARADRDEIFSRDTLEDLISRMESGEIDILVGTQMIAKGLDFPKLTMVGLVLADVGFNMPDFRSTERSFQLLTQVSGRSGRHVADGGQVIVQTYNPEHTCLPHVIAGDFESFAREEILLREELQYPPVGRLAAIRIVAKSLDLGESMSEKIADRASALVQKFTAYEAIQVLGPAAAPLSKLRGKYRFHLLLKAPATNLLSTFCRQLLADKTLVLPGTKIQIDIDPLQLM